MAKCEYFKPYMHTLRKLIGNFYQLEGCSAGGPLHILLDDDNYDIGSIMFCMNHCFEGLINFDKEPQHYSKEVYLLGIMICNEYAKMSLEERATFDSYLCGQTLECTYECGSGVHCEDIRGEVYEWMLEAEENHKEKTNETT